MEFCYGFVRADYGFEIYDIPGLSRRSSTACSLHYQNSWTSALSGK